MAIEVSQYMFEWKNAQSVKSVNHDLFRTPPMPTPITRGRSRFRIPKPETDAVSVYQLLVAHIVSPVGLELLEERLSRIQQRVRDAGCVGIGDRDVDAREYRPVIDVDSNRFQITAAVGLGYTGKAPPQPMSARS